MKDCPQLTVKSKDVHRLTIQIMTGMSLGLAKTKEELQTLFHVLLFAATHRWSIHQTCQTLSDTPSDVTIRNHLRVSTSDFGRLERRLNDAYARQLPKNFGRKGRRVAIDLKECPYHGVVKDEHDGEVRRSKAKSGTTHFFTYATAYAVVRGRRYTLAIYRVRRDDTMHAILKKLLRRLSYIGFQVSLLMLDRGFCSVDVIRYLQRRKQPFLMPLPKRGKKAREDGGPTGSQRLACMKTSCWLKYRMTNDKKRSVYFDVAVVCINLKGHRGNYGREALLYATYGVSHRPLSWVKHTYKTRFGIESSYRQLGQARIKTTTQHPGLRLLFVGLSLLLRNIWVWLHIEIIPTPKRGVKTVQSPLLRFDRLLLWLQLEVLDRHPPRREIPAGRDIDEATDVFFKY